MRRRRRQRQGDVDNDGVEGALGGYLGQRACCAVMCSDVWSGAFDVKFLVGCSRANLPDQGAHDKRKQGK